MFAVQKPKYQLVLVGRQQSKSVYTKAGHAGLLAYRLLQAIEQQCLCIYTAIPWFVWGQRQAQPALLSWACSHL